MYRRIIEMCGSFGKLSSFVEAIPLISIIVTLIILSVILYVFYINAPQPPPITANETEVLNYINAVIMHSDEEVTVLTDVLIVFPIVTIIVTILSSVYIIQKREKIDKTREIVLKNTNVIAKAVDEKLRKLGLDVKLTNVTTTNLDDIVMLESRADGSTIVIAVALWNGKVCIGLDKPEEVYLKVKLSELIRS